jgi:hypothetical protein
MEAMRKVRAKSSNRAVLHRVRSLQRLGLSADGAPFVGGIANAVSFAWAIGVTFPLLAG